MFQKKLSADDLYMKGLNLLLDGNREEAFKYLTQCAQEDSENADAFFHAGNILRDQGRFERAERIHSELLMRPELAPEIRKKVKLALIRDYIAQKKFVKAEVLLQEAMKTSKSLWLLEELLKIHENTKEWEKAIEIKAEIDKWKGAPDNPLMALYYLESARTLMASDGHAARLLFKEAIKRNPGMPWPYILIADTYFKENRAEDALDFWAKLFDEQASKAYLIFDKIEKYFYESGAYGEVGRIYRELTEREPENIDALLALSGYLFKRGDREEALSYCRKALEINPNSREAYAELLSQTMDRSGCDEEIKALVHEMLKMFPARKRFKCRVCMHRTEIPHWRCNACGAWNPYEV